jgi:hypothetical protein
MASVTIEYFEMREGEVKDFVLTLFSDCAPINLAGCTISSKIADLLQVEVATASIQVLDSTFGRVRASLPAIAKGIYIWDIKIVKPSGTVEYTPTRYLKVWGTAT